MDYGVPEQNVAVYGEEEPQYEGHYEAEEGNYGSIDNIDDSAGIKHDSSSSAGKLFVGGIAWETSEESFSRYFAKYGELTDSVIMLDKISGRPRGFGFVTFADPEVAEKVLQEDHVIDGRAVEVKRTVPREDMQGRGVSKTKKIFVGGLPLSLNEDDLREYFSSYGNIVEHQIMLDHKTGRSRGFGFVTFESEDAVEKIFSDGRMHELGGKQVEIKRAEPKRSGFDHSNDRFRRGSTSSKSSGNYVGGSEGFGGGYGGKMGRGYGGYGSYGGGYGGYGNFAGNYPGGAAGFYGGYGGYGYGYGFGGPMYGGGAYGGGGFGAPVGYGGAAGYGVGKGGYSGPGGGYDGGKGFGGSGSGGGYGPAKGYGGGGGGSAGGYGSSKGYGNGSATTGRFHPYRK
ncbi:RNA-binding protein musashi/mRNA cleavage and polyadenylation factor I complex, subunit HRP1 [Handroanthus impetiginosus]|uniref:RNA-binding protein musashi/mRNA cleavage and polyadenylation factor I complex, subunit HRP1 n=1 Tax=Handroanthus impetiginosus TaxID=429701 RepID=A0A2G9HXQ6_9LAMI|nr:RNA-binding protein musashi/mRNA cleavage and polyadenylation factor I complex, subunit HRP1 [Handroanthus impetiginosus]